MRLWTLPRQPRYIEAGNAGNMGELFANDRIGDIPMEFVPMNERELSSMLVEPGDLLFARQSLVLAGAGKCSIVQEASEVTTFESHIIRVRLKRDVADPQFFFYYFRSVNCGIRSIVTQGVQAGIRGNDLKRLSVHIPPLEAQKKVAYILSAYDDMIENNRRRIQLLEQAARLLYKEWFVRLRFPGHEHTKIINGIPERWEDTFLPDVIDVNPKTPIEKGKEIWYVPMSALSTSDMSADVNDFERRTNHTTVKFKKSDVLLARITPCLENGKTGFAYFLVDDEVACGSTEFIVLRGRRVSPMFTYCLARSYSFRENAIKSMIGSSGRQRVQESCFNEYRVPLPPKHLLDMFDDMSKGIFEQVRVLVPQNNKLVRARDLLLPRLMNGEIAA
jgi:type I restriction enzyme, S subunit